MTEIAKEQRLKLGLIRKCKERTLKENLGLLFLNLLLTVALLATPFIYIAWRGASRNVPDANKQPWIKFNDDPSTSACIAWESKENTTSWVQYGLDPGNLDENQTVIGYSGFMHVVNLTGLTPNSKYYYQVGYTEQPGGAFIPHVFGDIWHFWTAPATTDVPFSFLAISDTQESALGMHHHNRVARALARYKDDARFIINGGDVANYGQEQDSWDLFFKCARPYSPCIPFAFTLGNHDDMGSNQPMYRKYFSFNDPGEPLYYSFNYSMLHFVSIPIPWGNPSEFTKFGFMNWLEDDLNKSKDMKYKLVTFHCPLLSSGFFGRNRFLEENLHPLLDEYNVTLVISGHSHHYERCYMDGITYMVAAGGGGLMDPCHHRLPETQLVASHPHYLKIDCTTSNLTVSALTPDGILFDQAVLGGAA